MEILEWLKSLPEVILYLLAMSLMVSAIEDILVNLTPIMKFGIGMSLGVVGVLIGFKMRDL